MLVDHHCHLDFPELLADLDGVIARAAAAEVGTLVTISTRIRRFERIRALIEHSPAVYGSVGTHPHYAHEELDISVEEIVDIAERHPRVIAIGEAGLDHYYTDKAPREAQALGFRTHIEAARRAGLPLVIHSRDADADTARILEEEMAKGAFRFVLHCFTGGIDLARRAVALGGYVSFSGVLTFKKSEALREVARAMPLDRLLVETDSPYLAPEPYRGKRNEPAHVVHTARVLAATKGVSDQALAAATTENFLRLYAKAAPLEKARAG
ncbi:MAG: TatD family hydrolase [Hyphomicrobiaceae bacterium]